MHVRYAASSIDEANATRHRREPHAAMVARSPRPALSARAAPKEAIERGAASN